MLKTGGDTMNINENFQDFPKELAETIIDGQQHGVSDDLMLKGMISVGNLMAKFVKPDTPEEALLSEIWQTASPQEKEVMAGVVLRMGKKRMTKH